MRLIRCLLLLCVLAAPLAAQTPDSTRRDSVLTLEPIEVVGSIQPSAGPTVGSGVPARITIIGEEAADAYEPRILSDVLSQQPGISIYDDLGSPYKLNVSTRGFYASPVVGLPQGVSVFLDGVRQNEPDAAQVNFDLLPMQYVRRIELLSGTASLTGRNTLGGAINLVTARGRGPIGGELEVQGGSFETFNGNGSVSGVTRGGIDYYVGAGYNREDGWRQGTGAEQYNGFFNVGRLADTWGISLQGFGANSYAEPAGSLPQSVFDVKPDSNLTTGDFDDIDLVQLAVTGYRQLGTGRGSFRLYGRRSTAERFAVNQGGDPDALGESRNKTLGGGVDYRWARQLGAAVLGVRAGADGSVNDSRIELFEDNTKFGGGLDQTTLVESPSWDAAAFATADLTLGRVTLSGGARLDHIRIPFNNRLDPTVDTVSNYTRVNPKGGVSVDLGRGFSTYGSVGQNFRAPALIELACADPERPCVLPFALGDDPPLEPIIATTYEVGGTLARGPALVTASVFRTDVKNDVFLFPNENVVTGSTIEGYFDNLDKTRREGVEVGASVGFGRGHSAYANYAWTRATFQSAAEIFSIREEAGGENEVEPGDRLPLVPDHQVKFGASFRLPGRIQLGVDARYVGQQWLRGDEANETEPLDGWFAADARLTWEFGLWEVTGLVTNLLDEHYANFGTFNINQGNPAGPTLERFLTPGQARAFRLVVRRSFGAREAQERGPDLD
jgi:outer membrane receptor protein involved in Fe transport